MKKHLSLLLVFLLVLGMTAFATTPATKVYLSYDLPDETKDFEKWRDATTGEVLRDAAVQNKATLALDAYRTAGKKVLIGGTYWMYGKDNASANTFFVKNSNGNYVIDSASTTTQHDIIFLAPSSWDGSVKTNETYVVSYDLTYDSASAGDKHVIKNGTQQGNTSVVNYPGTTGNNYRIASVYGLNAEGTTYNRSSQFGYVPYALIPVSTAGSYDNALKFNTVFGSFQYGNAYRFAAGYKYDGTKEQLLKTLAVDGAVWQANFADSTKIKSIDAFHTALGAINPMVGKIRMYTIDNTVPFAVASTATEAVSPLDKKVTIKFNRPIASLKNNQVTMKANGSNFTAFTVGDVKMVESGTDIYSTVEINLTSILEPTSTYEIIINENASDEIGNKIGSTNNTATFTTGSFPVFNAELSASGMQSGDSISVLTGKTATFNSAFTNTDSAPVEAVLFIGIYSVGADEIEDTADDKLIGYSLAKTTLAAGSTQNVGFGTKVDAGTYVKALSFGDLSNYASGVDFNSTNVGIN